MPKYEAEIEIPFFHDAGDFERWIEALREFGHPKILLRTEGPSRKVAVEEMANSCSVWWPRWDDTYWNDAIRVIRGKRSHDEI